MITLFDIFKHSGIDTEKIKLVRHGNKQIPILETFQNNIDKLQAYQSFQNQNKFSSAEQIAVFAPDKKTSALFLGFWDILDSVPSSRYTKKIHRLIEKYDFPEDWHNGIVYYKLKYNPILEELSERLIIEWGAGTVAWVQKSNKEILEIKGKNSIGDFKSYDLVHLKYSDLRKIVNNPTSNITWVTALSNVNGIYLIRYTTSGKLYVGSSYGRRGIFGRWESYARSGHGGNKELYILDADNFEFSILEILPSTFSADDVIEKENRWKMKLGTRINGLNRN